MNKTAIISLGGSLIYPEHLDVEYLKGFKKTILDFVKDGNRAVIVTGGGATARKYIAAARELNPHSKPSELDWVGIRTTQANAELVRVIFGNVAYPEPIFNFRKKITKPFKILVGGGYKPGTSTDFDTVELAKKFKASSIVNLSNIDYLFDKDPNKHKDAKKITNISWVDFRKMVGNKFISGGNYPFDPIASKLAQKERIGVVIMNGKNLANFKNYLSGESFQGTRIG